MKKILFILLLPLTLFAQSQKISDMTSATTLAGTEYVPIVQTTNKKATVSLLRGFGSYGSAGQYMIVNGTANGFTFVTPPFINAYPGAGIAVSTGSAWGTSITDNSANWNTVFGWGNHASGGYEVTTNKATDLGTMNSTLYPTTGSLFARRNVTTTDAIVQTDNGKTIVFNSASPFNFTLDAMTIETFVSFYNKGAGTVTFINGSGVTLSGTATLATGASNAVYYESTTTPIILSSPAAYTDEQAQDAIGGILVDGTTIDFTYTDGTPSITAERAALTGAVTATAGSNATLLGSFNKAALDGAVSDGNVLYDGDAWKLTGTSTVTGNTDIDFNELYTLNLFDTKSFSVNAVGNVGQYINLTAQETGSDESSALSLLPNGSRFNYFKGAPADGETYEANYDFDGNGLVQKFSKNVTGTGRATEVRIGSGADTESAIDGFHVYTSNSGYSVIDAGLKFRIRRTGEVTLNLGSDANEDSYVRRGGYFTRIPVGSNGNVWTVTGGTVGWAAPALGSFTKAQLNTAISDGNAIYEGTNAFNGGFSVTANSGANPITFDTSGPGNSGDITLQTGAADDIILSGTSLLSTTKITSSATIGNSSAFNVAPTASVSAPINGDFWITSTEANARVNGATASFAGVNTGNQTISVTGTTTATLDLSADASDATITGAGISAVSVVGDAITITSTEVDGSVSNELQTVTNSSAATTHTVTLSNSGGSVQLVEGANITLTTTGTAADGIVTIASTGGGGGITNGAAANELMKSDGTNAVASGLGSTALGDLNLGLTGTTGATRTIQATGSASDISTYVYSKGLGGVVISTPSGKESIGVGDNVIYNQIVSALTNTTKNAHSVNHYTTATAAVGFGVEQEFNIEDAGNNTVIAGKKVYRLTDATSTSGDTDEDTYLAVNGTSTLRQTLKGTGQLQLPSYTSSSSFTGTAVANLQVDASGNILTTAVGGGSGLTYAQVKAMKFK